MKPIVCQLLTDPPMSGPLNMAIDEVLLETVARTGDPVLRFYAWSEPTLSLGYFQSVASRSQHRESLLCPVVRRATGGGAILHDRELTYSLIWPQRRRLAREGWKSTKGTEWVYQWVHQSLINGLGALNINAQFCRASQCEKESFLCFERTSHWDVVVAGMKILGSAQRSRSGGLLQHGSLLLATSPAAPQLTGLHEQGHSLSRETAMKIWVAQIATMADLSFEPIELDAAQKRAAAQLVEEKYGSPKWTKKR